MSDAIWAIQTPFGLTVGTDCSLTERTRWHAVKTGALRKPLRAAELGLTRVGLAQRVLLFTAV
jgi:hypothetical protein